MSIHLKRTATILKPDPSRVLLRPYSPGKPERVGRIIVRILALPEYQVGPLLCGICAEFSQRHQEIHKLFLERFEQIRRSEEHTSELQSHLNLVCRLLLEKKKKTLKNQKQISENFATNRH